MLTTGLGIQVALKLVFNVRRIMTKPSSVKQIFFKRDVLALASFLAGFTGIFRVNIILLKNEMTQKKVLYI